MNWEVVLSNLINVGYGLGIFICAYLSNMAFSLWYNIKVLSQPFDIIKIRDSAIKIVAFGGGLALLCVTVATLPEFATTVGWTIPDDYKDVFENIVIIGSFLLASCKYALEAWNKMKAILFEKINNNTNSNTNENTNSDNNIPTPIV